LGVVDWRRELADVRRALAEACKNPIAQQDAFVAALLDRIAGSAFARDHGLERGMSAADYRARVPIRTVLDFQGYVDRAYEGEPDVLFPGHPTFFAQTSGSTGKPKLIAFSQHAHAVARAFVFSINAATPEELIASGVVLLGKFNEATSPGGVPVGAAAGFHRRALADVPAYGAIPDPIAELADPDARNYGALRVLLGRPLLQLTSLNPSTILALFDLLRRSAGDLVEDLRAGGIARGPLRVRDAMRDHALPPAPERAARLETWSREGSDDVTQVWPELRRVVTWQEGSLGLYIPRLTAQLPGVELRKLQVGASEGHGMAAPPSGLDASIPSLLCAYFEFVPADAAPPNDANTVPLDQLEIGGEYRIVISNDRGLYRVLTDDVFRVVGWEDKVPILLFLQRHGLNSSLTGEKLTEVHAAVALSRALPQLVASPRGAQIVPEWREGSPARYAVTLELERGESRDKLREFLQTIEATLREQNLEYAAKRDSHRLAAPVLLVLKSGSFERERLAMTADRNRSDTQYKLLPLARDVLDRTSLAIELEIDL
jgi:hypothetical protein